jgi:hypothetical protein
MTMEGLTGFECHRISRKPAAGIDLPSLEGHATNMI